MAGRFPGAENVERFWENLCGGVESIRGFQPDELEGSEAAELSRPNYVRARGILDGVEEFDAAFFAMHPTEAELTDPQHRVFLECSWEALEDAGIDPGAYAGAIGVFAGCSPSTYFLRNVCQSRQFIEQYTGSYQTGNYPAMLGANTDFLSTRVSYKLNLRGPSFTLHAGCATSLVAVSQACQSLLAYQSDVALAGGVSITLPQKRGYLYEEGGMVSPDGHCRPFDRKAQGTVFGSGAGVVVLKRAEEALADGDRIYAVIRGCGVTNDGSTKVGFAAPSVEGQAAAVAMAYGAAGVKASSITYVEAHGTATPLGDPIEFRALDQVFRTSGGDKGFCYLGSVKGNVGHLDVAAGVTGLIKTALAIYHKRLPATLHFEQPNARIDLERSPFRVVSHLTEWQQGAGPRRAGVSAMGVGGTNVHVVVEECPPLPSRKTSDRPQLLCLSAKSEAALEKATLRLGEFLGRHPESDLRDVAYTLASGRRHFDHRRILVTTEGAAAAAALSSPDPKELVTSQRRDREFSAAFLFPGQGTQYAGMGAELYRHYPVFRDRIDRCAAIVKEDLGFDLREWLYPEPNAQEEAAARISDTIVAQPALFATEYALANLWMEWGIRPSSMIGHSVGEFVAACLAGVFALEDALSILAARSRLMQELPVGKMTAVLLPEQELLPLLNGNLSLAAVNAPSSCVAAGAGEGIEHLEEELSRRGCSFRRLPAGHAFHSWMMDPIVAPFTQCVRQIRLAPPQIPYISSVSGTWIRPEEATDPNYWARHFRETVRFSSGIQVLRSSGPAVLIETGPGNTLTNLARQHPAREAQIVVPSLAASARASEEVAMLQALGRVWAVGASPNWTALGGEGRRISLPTYSFERKRHWIDILPSQEAHKGAALRESPVASGPREAAEMSANEPIKSMITGNRRQERLVAGLTAIFEELSGVDGAGLDPATPFLELGFDSLVLTQVAQAIQAKWKLRVTFRQIMEDYGSLAALAAHLEAQLPPDVEAVPVEMADAPIPETPPAALPAEAGGARVNLTEAPVTDAGVERILRDQLSLLSEVFKQQLELLRRPGSQAMSPGTEREVATQAVLPSRQNPAAAAAGNTEFKPFGPYKPAQKGPPGGLTERQKAHLGDLVTRYNARTTTSKELAQNNRGVLADPRAAAGFRAQWKEMVYPIVSARSKGSKFWDVDGNEYIDIVNGYGPIFFGHMPDFLHQAITEQLAKGIETGPQSPLAGEVAALVSELTGMERVTFSNTGSEAVMAALRVARTVTARSKVVMFAGDYHGTFDEVLAKPVPRGNEIRSVPVAPGILPAQVENIVVLEYGAKESLQYIRDHAQELAAVLVEPVQSRHPDLQPVEFLRKLRALTEESGTALIFDEVVTGFRAHPGGVQALFGISADIATYGKVAAGGMPIGIVAGKRRFMDALDGGAWNYGDGSTPEVGVTFFAGTFVRHPLALAAARAVLLEIRSQGPALQENLNRRTKGFAERLNGIFAELELPVRASQFSSFFYFSIPAEYRFGGLLYYHLREKGVHIQEGFPCFLTTAHSDEDLDRIARAFRDSLIEMQEADMLPKPERAASPTPVIAEPIWAPLTEAQREIWLSAALCDEASCAYNEAVSLRMRGKLDVAALRQALRDLIARHQALRGSVDTARECLVIHPRLELELPLIDLSDLGAAEREQALSNALETNAKTAFDLTAGPLVRAQLFRLEPEAHALLFTAHHIVCDGWSTNVLLEELGRIYTALTQARVCTLPPARSFAEYAQQAERAGGEPGPAEAYWLKEFAQLPEPLNLPLDRPRQPERSYRGATYRHRIGKEAFDRIRRAGAKKGATAFVSLLAGFEALLCRLAGQHEVVVGIPAAAQSLLDDQTLVGHCVQFLPVRGQVGAEMTAGDLVVATKKKLLDAYEHQSYTYGTLLRKLAVPRDPSRLPLIDVQFNVERVGERLAMAGLEVKADPAAKAFVNFDLFVNIVESSDGLSIDCDYNTALFDAQTIHHWMKCYETLLGGMAEDPSRPVMRIALLAADDLDRVLVEWTRTATEYPRNASLASLFEEQCRQTPDAIAVSFQKLQLSYEELNGKANRLAHYLRAKGVTEGNAVGLCLDRSLDAIVSILAIVKAGGAYVPLDPSYPRERLRFLVEDADLTMVIADSPSAAKLPSSAVLVRLDREQHEIALHSSENLVNQSANGDSLAYVMYTSGSTGQPKGALIPQRAIVRLVKNTNYCNLATDDAVLQLAPLSFDASTFEIWAPLLNGGRLAVMNPGLASLEEISQSVREEKITTLWLAAGLFHAIVDQNPEALRPLRRLLAGGDVLSPDHVNRFLEAAPGCALINGYGPTEGTTFTCCHPIAPVREGSVPIGRPISNTQVYILDPLGQPVPIGAAGELFIGGDGLAMGYLKRPELTAERFVVVELPSGKKERLYRSGDLARYRNDGTVEFLGRADTQVKIRGYRVETGEIEQRIRQYPGVRDATVVAREDHPGERRLVGYVVIDRAKVGIAPRSYFQRLRQSLQDELPDYLVPAILIDVPELPLTNNGKVDRRALPAPEAQAGNNGRTITPPTRPFERELLEVWKQVLPADAFGVEDNVFEIGADSLLIFRMTALANQQGMRFSPKAVFQYRTIRGIAAHLATQQATPAAGPLLVPVSREMFRR
ncbi:MAG: amino acid adenylation domain-containing protein [Acidobacteriia bacterium]|nr:amino acid adenylation domain-containing protein [Terriglobia bacterium]